MIPTSPQTSAVKKVSMVISYCLLLIVALVVFIVLFFNLQRHQRETEEASLTAPKSGHFVKAADLNIFVQEAGPAEGEPVVLIHGTGSWSEIWRDTITPLAKAGFHVVALDLPPFGYSDMPSGAEQFTRTLQAARIAGMLESLNIQKATLVAHSVSSRVALETALRYPDRFKKIVLVDPALGFPKITDTEKEPDMVPNDPGIIIKTIFGHKPLLNAVISTYGTNPLSIKKLFSSFVFDKTAITDVRIKVLQQPMKVRGTTEAYGDWLENLLVTRDTDSESIHSSNLKKLKMPIDIIWGSEDTVTPLWQGKDLQQLILGSNLHIIKGVGHMPYLENVTEFNSVLLQILNK